MYDILDVENKYNVILDMVRDAIGMSKVDWLDRYNTASFIRIVQPRSGVHSEDHLEKIYDDIQDEIKFHGKMFEIVATANDNIRLKPV